MNVQHVLTLKSSGSWPNFCLPALPLRLAVRKQRRRADDLREADGREQSKGLSELIPCSTASQFRLYANIMSFAEAGRL